MSRQQISRDGGSAAISGPRTLASDADRDAVARALGAAFAEGRLDAGEHGERVHAAYAARTWQELRHLTADLPEQGGKTAGAMVGTRPLCLVDRCLMCALMIACPPAGIIWMLMARNRPRGTHAEDQ
jgi:hypothetical protein